MDRRGLLARLGAVAAAGIGGCLGGAGGESTPQVPTPVALSGQKLDDEGGMVIGAHGGPNGQVFYADHAPDGHDNPAWFHTLAFGLFPYYFAHRRQGWTARVAYVTDYSTVEYTLSESEAGPVISTHTAADSFGRAREQTYVVDSEVRGGMGPALIPFSMPADAQSFVDDHGGRTVAFGDVTPELIANYTR